MALTAVFLHSGQVCSAGARLIVEESIHDEFVDELVERAEQIRLGGPFDEKAETGALISAAHLDKVTAYVEAGVAEGAVLARRRTGPTTALAEGFFYPPTDPRRAAHRDERGAGRVVRAGAHRRDVHRRGRRGPDRQRLDLRPGRCGVDPGRRQGPADRGPAADGHGVDQRLPPVRRPGRVGRLQAVRHRPRARRRPGSTSTARPSTSGTTSRPRRQRWFAAMVASSGSGTTGTTSSSVAGRPAVRSPTGSLPTRDDACWCSRRVAPTSGSTRSSTCRRRCRSRSATGSTTGSTRPSRSRR